jgi:hypothetical protein
MIATKMMIVMVYGAQLIKRIAQELGLLEAYSSVTHGTILQVGCEESVVYEHSVGVSQGTPSSHPSDLSLLNGEASWFELFFL